MKTKTILIKFEVPQDFDFENTHYPRVEIRESPGGDVVEDDIECEIITTPTEEEIEKMANEKPISSGHICNRKYGASWYKQRLGL